MKYIILVALLVFAACSPETKIVSSTGHSTEEIDLAECCADVEGYACYFGPTDYNQAELVRLANDSASWRQVHLVFIPGEGVLLDCIETGVYRLTWN